MCRRSWPCRSTISKRNWSWKMLAERALEQILPTSLIHKEMARPGIELIIPVIACSRMQPRTHGESSSWDRAYKFVQTPHICIRIACMSAFCRMASEVALFPRGQRCIDRSHSFQLLPILHSIAS